MTILGAIVGFILGFIVGQFVLMTLFSGGRHQIVAAHPKLKVWAGLLVIIIAVVCAYLGYKIAA